MNAHPLDAPEILDALFYPRRANRAARPQPDYTDGLIPVAEGVALGYRWYRQADPSTPILLFFHGNGEIASDYDLLAPFYAACGLSLFVADYRGYGWSEGAPLVSTLLSDAEAVLLALPAALAVHGLATVPPLFVKGRSLGSAPAIYAAYRQPALLRGLIVESGFADAPSLFGRIGIPIPAAFSQDDSLPLDNARKIGQVSLPTLILHGEADALLPLAHGQALYQASASPAKQLVIIESAGHNDVQVRDMAAYFSAIHRFVQGAMAG